MFQTISKLQTHLLILALAAGLLFFLKLGTPSLWDIDEGNNAEASREMLETDNWVVPTFNYELRVDKPALLYWLQMAAYRMHGINEFSARLPSALAAFAAVFVLYALGRRMFGPMEGLLAGLILASSVAFCASAHFANPDALLNLCAISTLTLFWLDYSRGARTWFWTAGIMAGFGVLAKGPVGVILPATVVLVFLLWEKKLAILRDWRLLGGVLLLALVAVPWYALVGVETKADFLIGFLLKHNLGRFVEPMEKHGGSPFYYLFVVLAGFGPWAVFLLSTFWFGTGDRAREHGATLAANRFLWCWIGVYLLFFSLAGTKLPNYILPLYAPLALLMARFLERWRTGEFAVVWPLRVSLICLVLVGVGTSVTFLLVGGALPGDLLRGQYLPGFRYWAGLGALPVVTAAGCWFCLNLGRRGILLASLALMAVLFASGLIVCASVTLDQQKAPRFLTANAGACQPEEEIRTAAFAYFQPSLVFYCQREVTRLDTEVQARDFLRSPLLSFLFVPETIWQTLQPTMPASCRVVDSHYELYRRCRVVVVANR
jgi:4-amino-4-deoxy-L-arabinose transferase-like glycosyltransferase